MRTWHDWNHDEREFFVRIARENWKHKGSDPELVSHVEALKLDMFCRELDMFDITKGNNVLDALEMGLSRAQMSTGLNEAGKFFLDL